MIDKEKLNKLSKRLTSEDDDFMRNLRRNLELYIAEPDITIKDISEDANISFSTLNSLLYGNAMDCKLSTAIALAKALNVSIDELVGASTVSPITSESLALCRNLPDNALYLIRWYIRHQYSQYKKKPDNKRIVSIMMIKCNHNGSLKLSDLFKDLDITHLSSEIKSKVFFGIAIPCEHYVPTYTPYDILLIANDRQAMPGEHNLVLINNCLFILERKIKDGIAKFYSIRDGRYHIDEDDVDEVIGYVAEVYPNGLPHLT